MKKLLFVFIIIIFGTSVKTHAIVKQDSITIRFGNNSQIIIYLSDKEDLETIQQYDLNKIITDLRLSIDSAENASYLKIEDQTGEKYLQDTIIRFEDREISKTRVKLGNIEVTVDIDDIDENTDWSKSSHKKYVEEYKPQTEHFFNVGLGVNNWLEDGIFPETNNQPYGIKPFGSWYVELMSNWRSPVAGKFFIQWGANVSWYTFKFDDQQIRLVKGEDNVEFITDSRDAIKSKLNASYFNVSFMPMLDFGSGKRLIKDDQHGEVNIKRYKKLGFRIGLGGYAGYRLGSKTKFVYHEDGGDREKVKDQGSFFLNNFRYGLRALLGYRGFDVFVNYDLNEVFTNNRGPNGSAGLNAISFGIIL